MPAPRFKEVYGKLRIEGINRGSRVKRAAIAALFLLVFIAAGASWSRRQHSYTIVFRHMGPFTIITPTGSIYPDPPGILLHHSDTPAKLHGVTFNAATLDRIAQQRGFSVTFEGKTYHISYHYVILPDGTVQPGRPEHCPGAHCPKYNNWLGICLIGDFHQNRHWWPSTPTDAQKASLVSLCESLMSKYHIPPENVRRHRDVHETYCPGKRFPFAEIIHTLRIYAAAHPETREGAGTVAAANRPQPAS